MGSSKGNVVKELGGSNHCISVKTSNIKNQKGVSYIELLKLG